MKRIAFVVNGEKPAAGRLARALADRARAAGVRARRTKDWPVPQGFLEGVHLCFVIGGDGTLLGVAQEAALRQVPVVGINLGSLGFLTNFSAEDAERDFERLLDGEFVISRRSLLSCHAPGGERLALNDIVIKEPGNVRMLKLEVFADSEPVTEYHCDGLIVGTPTGSTAYTLSAGGPIIHPASEVLSVTPICPHTLSNRTVILRDSVRLRVVNRTRGSRLQVAVDGQGDLLIGEGQSLEVTRAEAQVLLAQRQDSSHFEVIRSKLQWSGSHVRPLRDR